MTKEKIRDLFTCKNCQWEAQCGEENICEYYDSLSPLEEEFEEKIMVDMGRAQFHEEWLEYIEE